MKTLLALLLYSISAIAQVAQMPNAFKIGPEGITIISAPANTVLQFGIGTTWEPPFALTASSLPLYAYYSVLGDPAPNILKEIDAQQQATAYTVTYTAAGSTTPITVNIPALVGASVTIPIGGTCTTSVVGNSLVLTIK